MPVYNRRMRTVVLAFSAVLVASSVNAQPRPVLSDRPALSRTEADALDRKFDELNDRHKAGRVIRGTVLVTESEVNSYLNLSPSVKLPRGLSDVVVRLEQERIHATGILDLDKVRDKMPNLSPLSPLYWLSGQVPVLLRGRLVNDDGFATVEWEDVRVGNIPVPISLLHQIVSSTTKSEDRPDGFDIRAPFRLPYSLRQVRIEPGRAYLDF
jgi:hypothetical protein